MTKRSRVRISPSPLFDKNQAQGNVGLYKFQAQRAFT
uniref:Uncharacterized protein n=1 Tax=Populus trichocarpa TaxID=3694 RepID=A0A3N7HTB8_POPTR